MEKSSNKNSQNIVIMVLIAIIFAGGGFFAGTKYQQKQLVGQRNQIMGQFGNRDGNASNNGLGRGDVAGRAMGGFRGGQIMGDIISVDDKSVTVKLADGSSKIILFSSATSINRAAEATTADLKVGDKVAAFGTANTDGSVTAQNIQLNPIMRERLNDNISPTATPVK
jgi:hypothetical protein